MSVILLVAGVAWGGSSVRPDSRILSAAGLTGEGYGSYMDAAGAANVAAVIAAETDLLVVTEAAKTADNLNAQVSLHTSGEGYLAKNQVVTTAGDATRGIETYSVASGDTLSQVASKFNITTGTIRWANNLAGDEIKPGQQLLILPISGLLHTVQAGDTAETLAAKFQSNAAQIISYNNAEVDGLKVGSKIIIPDGVKVEAPKPRTQPATLLATASTPRLTSYGFSGNGYSYGYCTWYAASRRGVPGNWGNARNWFYNAKAAGFGTGRTPVPGAIAWSSAMSWAGHVGIVEAVNGDQVLIADMNGPGGWGRVARYWTSTSTWGGYIY